MKFDESRLDSIFSKISQSHIAVVGDLMIDRYVWGVVERISPEAPVPIINLTGESTNLGGAANVASNISSLGAQASLYGIVGDDNEGKQLREIVRNSGFSDEWLVDDPSRPTSTKTRVIAQNQHVVRIDHENTTDIGPELENLLLERFSQNLSSIDAVILEDYNKGVLTPRVIDEIILICRDRGIPVGVDPKKANFWSYKRATLFKPNLKELETAVGSKLRSDEALKIAARDVIKEMQLEYLLVTRGEHGMALFSKDQTVFMPTKAHNVHDVSGAGDTVIATMVASLAGGADIVEAAHLANTAASIVIAEIGAVPIDAADLKRACIGR